MEFYNLEIISSIQELNDRLTETNKGISGVFNSIFEKRRILDQNDSQFIKKTLYLYHIGLRLTDFPSVFSADKISRLWNEISILNMELMKLSTILGDGKYITYNDEFVSYDELTEKVMKYVNAIIANEKSAQQLTVINHGNTSMTENLRFFRI